MEGGRERAREGGKERREGGERKGFVVLGWIFLFKYLWGILAFDNFIHKHCGYCPAPPPLISLLPIHPCQPPSSLQISIPYLPPFTFMCVPKSLSEAVCVTTAWNDPSEPTVLTSAQLSAFLPCLPNSVSSKTKQAVSNRNLGVPSLPTADS